MTWNPSDKSSEIVLSNGNFTATSSYASGLGATVRSTTSKSSGKVYFEITGSTLTNNWTAGIATSGFNLYDTLGSPSSSYGFYPVSPTQTSFINTVWLNGGSSASSNGEVVSFALDLTAMRAWVTTPTMRGAGHNWNNSSTANPATNTGGIDISSIDAGPWFIAFNDDIGGGVAVLNINGPFSVSLPSGFSAWGGTPSVTLTGVAGTAQVGLPVRPRTIAGVAATPAVGTPTRSLSFSIAGVAASAQRGVIVFTPGVAISGTSATAAVGAPLPSIGLANSPWAAAFSAAFGASASAQAMFSGVSAGAQVGILRGRSFQMSGVSATGVVGSLSTYVSLAGPPVVLPGPVFFTMELDAYRPGAALTQTFTYGHASTPNAALSLFAQALESTTSVIASDMGYRTRQTDAGGLRVYPPIMTEAFQIDRTVNLDPSSSEVSGAWGTIKLVNPDGLLDSIASDWNAEGRPVRVLWGRKLHDLSRGYLGDPAYASLKPAFIGQATHLFLSSAALEIPLRDPGYQLETSIQKKVYAGTGAYEGSGELSGVRIPMARGGTSAEPIRNVTPVLVDATRLIYQYNDGPGTVVNLYEGAAKTITFSTNTTDLYAGVTPPGQYRTDNNRGLFQLGSVPSSTYQITCDVTGQFTSGTHTTILSLARYLLTDDLAVDAASLDLASFSVADAAYPYVAGVFVPPDQDLTGSQVINTVLASIGAKLIPTRTGQLRVVVVRAAPVGVGIAATLDETKIVELAPRQLPTVLDPPPSKLRVGYQHNYTVQTSGINTATSTAAQRAFVAAADRFATWFSAGNATATRRVNDPPPITGVLLSRTDAEIVATELGALWGVRQRLYDITLPASISLDLEVGEFVVVRFPLGDLVNGKTCQIVGESLNSGAATSTFRVLGLPAQVGVRPGKVTGLRVVRTTASAADLAWNAQTDAIRYQVQYRQSGVGSYQNVGAQTTATTFTVSGLATNTSGIAYDFIVYAINAFGPGTSSDVVTGTTVASTGTPVASTWNPADKSAAIVLSNGNLTATASGTTRQGVRSTTSKSSGKVYFEITGTALTTNWTVGVATAAMPFNSEPGTTAAAMGVHVTSPDPTSVKINGINLITSAWPDGDGAVVSCALDLTNRVGWVSTTAMRTIAIVSTGDAFTDRNGVSWSIIGGQVAVNGVADAGTSNVVMLAYVSGRTWQRNTANQWFYKDSPTATAWTGGSTPTPLLAPPSMGFTDTRGNTWALASGQVVANGTVDTTTANVIQIVSAYGQVWQKNTAGLWWAKTTPSDAWSPTTGTSTAPVPERLWNNSPTASPATGTGGFSLSQLTSAAYHVVFSDAPGTVAATGNFVIQNGAIYAPDGKRFIARGINADPVNQGIGLSDIQSLFPGINFIRWAHGALDDPSYYAAFAAECTAAKVPVILYYHPYPFVPAHTGSDLTTLANWVASMANYPAYKNNPYVWFGSPNEPQSYGGDVPLITAEHVAVYNAVRTTAGANNIVVLSSGGGGGDPGNVGLGALSPTSAYATMRSIVWDLHFYGWMTSYSTDQATVNAKLLGSAGTSTGILAMKAIPSADGTIPVLIAEFGVSTNALNFDANKDQDVEAVTNWALIQNGHTQGLCAWQWYGDSFNALQNGGTLTEWGQNLRNRIISAGSYEAGLPGTSTSGGNGTAAGVAVLNTGGSAFTFSLPTGFTAWDANQSGGGTNPNPPSTGVPGAPPSITVSSFTSSAVTLSWAAPTTGGSATGYTVLYKRATATLYLTGATTTGALTATITGLDAGTAYDFRVYGTNSSGSGAQSATVSQTTATVGQTRLWYLQPGSNDSYWNTPLKDGAQWSDETHPMTISARRSNTVNAANFGTSIAIGRSTDPVIRFTSTGTSGDQRDAGLTADLHVPVGTRSVGPHPGDNHLVVFDLTQPYKMYSWYRVLTDGSATTASTTALTTYIAEYNDCDGLMEDRSSGLFGIDAGAGVIRQWQLDPAQNPTMRIQHSLRYGADATQLLPPPAWDDVTTVMPNNYGLPAILWPLTHSDYDGPTWYSGSLPPGATLGIPKDVPMPSGLSQGGQMLWWNAQNYGWLWRDQAGGGITLSAEKELENHPIIQQMRQDLATVVSRLRVLINQTGPSSRKGTGTPLIAGPPPLDLGTSIGRITINPISGVAQNTAFSVSGTLANYGSAPSLRYSVDGGAFAVLPGSPTVTASAFSFVHPAVSTAGTHTLIVADNANLTGIRATITYQVGAASGESPDRTVVLAGSTAAITDQNGNRWTITSGGQVAVNGTADTTTASVTQIAWVSRQLWQQNQAGLWWYKNVPTDAWQPTSGTSTSPLGSTTTSPNLLSTGPFTTSGSQIIDQNGVPQRINAIGWSGWSVIGFNPHGLEAGTYQQNMDTMKRVGFNAFRIPVNARGVLNNDAQLAVYDNIFDYAATIGLRVIVDCHNVEGTNSGNFGTQPPNGLWYSKNEGRYNGTDNTDGGGTTGTVTHFLFVQMWQSLATRWRNKPAILAYDIINEPQETGHANPGAYWANYRNIGTIGGDRDIRAMYQEVGNAIHAIDPRPLIICEALINFNSGSPEGDLRGVLNYPVVLNISNKVVYSVHTYGQYYTPYSGQSWVDRQMLQWGHLVRDNIAPVWIGECGGGMLTTREQDWGATAVPLFNGQWPNTFTFTGNQQGIGTDWWDWTADGDPAWQVVTSFVNGDLASAVRPYLEQLRPFATSSGGGGSGGGGGGGGGGSGGGTTPPTTPGNLGTWQTSTIRGMKYYWLMPDGYNAAYSYPLVLYLHYNGQSWRWYSYGTQNEYDDVLPTVDRYFNNTAFRQSYPCIVLVPLCDQSQGSAENFNWGGVNDATQASQTNNVDLINQFSSQYSINAQKRYVVGTSMGGIGSWSMIVKFNTLTGTHGRLLRAAMPFDGNPYEYSGSLQSVANNMRNVPVFAVHGRQDIEVSPAWDEQVYQYYGGSIPGNGTKAPNGNMWFSEPDFGHGSWNDGTYGIELPGARSRWDWLFSQ